MRPTYAAFDESEHRERLERARRTLRAQGIDLCISVAPEHLYYIGGYNSWVSVNSPQALIFATAGGEPTLVVRDVDAALPRETSWIADVRIYHLITDDVPELIAAIAREKGMAGGKVGIESQSYALPYALGQAIAQAIAPARLVDCTDSLSTIRLVKSEAEVRYVAEAARYANIGLDAARRALTPGMTEIALAGVVENAMRQAGSDYWSIPTELSSGPRTPGGHATPRARPIEPGDLVHLEFAGVSHRYHAAAIHTMCLGEPSPRARALYHHARQSLAAGIAAVRPGPGSAISRRHRSSRCAKRGSGPMPSCASAMASALPIHRSGSNRCRSPAASSKCWSRAWCSSSMPISSSPTRNSASFRAEPMR